MEDFSGLDGRRNRNDIAVPGAPQGAGGRRRFVYKKIRITINEAGRYISNAQFVLDKNIRSIEAITLTSDNEEKVFNLTQRLEINGVELLPQDFEARVIYAYASVPVADRYFDLNSEPAGNGVVKITCFDTSASAGFTAYHVNYYLKCLLAD